MAGGWRSGAAGIVAGVETDGGRAAPFWLRPKWVVGHVLVAVLVVVCVLAGLWQLRRLDERRTVNAAIESRSSLPVQPLDQVVDAGADLDQVGHLVYRRVTARGAYDADASVLVRSRSLDGRPGFHVLTPLVTDSGDAVMVNRGFTPFTDQPEQARIATRPAGGQVEVTGLLLATQEREGIGPTDPPEGVLSEIARVDLGRLQQQYGAELYPLYLQLHSQAPAPVAELPIALPPPEQSEGNHLGYAVQWFIFATIGAIGWPILLHNTARERRRGSSSGGVPGSRPADRAEAVVRAGEPASASASRP